MHAHTHAHRHAYAYTCTYMCLHMHVHTHMYTHRHAGTHTCTHINACTCTHTHKHRDTWFSLSMFKAVFLEVTIHSLVLSRASGCTFLATRASNLTVFPYIQFSALVSLSQESSDYISMEAVLINGGDKIL